MQSIKEHLGRNWSDFTAGIREYLASDIELLNTTNASLLANSGKQVRPLMSLLIARAIAGAASEDTVRYAISAELLHNATLLHDDVADKSDMRRGRPTLRALMGPEASVLVGDFWLVRALDAIMDCSVGRDECLQLFARTLGYLAEGEMLQLQKAGTCDTDQDDYLAIIYRKTSSLFVAATTSAAISVKATEMQKNAAAKYGEYIGYAFQIQDDILDYDGTSSVGKPLGADILEQKITLPLLGAFANAGAEQESAVRSAIKLNGPDLQQKVVDFVHSNNGVDYARKMLDIYVEKAIGELDAFPQSPEKEMLARMARYIAIRNK